MIQTSAASISEEMYEENDHNMMIKKLVANTFKIKKYMKYIAHCRAQQEEEEEEEEEQTEQRTDQGEGEHRAQEDYARAARSLALDARNQPTVLPAHRPVRQPAGQLPILCTKDGLWSEEFKLCEELCGECLPPQELNSVEYKCEQGYGIVIFLLQNFPVSMKSPQRDGGGHSTHPPFHPFQADGWCDTINNRAYCQYDGGDCCSSTVSSRK
ncbi:hypothetical protein JRQ81_014771, partial [Phrynocephalus forsythii]